MPEFYTYLISSLPVLQFGAKPEYSLERFMGMCRDLIPEEDYQTLGLCAGKALLDHPARQPTLKQWQAFETGLRNELVKVRASRRKIEPAKYLRPDGSGDSGLVHIAANSRRIPSPAEAEKFLDQERWKKLEELSFGHYFDLDALIIYCLKLRILLRWANISGADNQAQLKRVMELSEKH
ncbi:MAG: DUF2764 family protein [Candidatus Omnitrophica bacterium]|jgi:hypothetical protein|nr:DUF2764 domain-containing protein [Candidatus Omnitrophota bacterium]MDD5079993.1 DUF2764 family protein [Candidatus Omnitrophota bacterium]